MGPTRLIIDVVEIEVVEVLASTRGPDHDYFTVRCDDGRVYRLAHHREQDTWELLTVEGPT